jgi:Carboxypeptidase regulatory-like domain
MRTTKRTKRRRSPKKRIGISRWALPALLLLSFLPLRAAPKKKPALDTYAVLSGSVFTDGGYALPGADVTVAPEVPGDGSPKKTKPVEMVSDARGEFVVRVPPGPMHYLVNVSAKGYQSQQKTVGVQDQERVEVTFQLEPQSK